jgi:hypothetical protein
MRGAVSPLLQDAFMAWCLVKHRDNFTFHYLPSLLCDRYRRFFPRGYIGWGAKLTTHFHLVPKLGMHGVIHPPIGLDDDTLN